MKNFFQKFLLTLILLPSLVFPIGYISADGMMIRPDFDDWTYYSEKSQNAIISYENGRQTMILGVGTEILESNLVWIFPVPANPEEVTIDNSLEKSPNFYGENILEKAKEDVNIMEIALAANEVFPLISLPLMYLTTPDYLGNSKDFSMPGASSQSGLSTIDVTTVFEHIENNGMVSELITTTSTNALQKYFDDKNLEITADQLHSIKDYIGKDYSFVVSWISDNISTTLSESINKITSPLGLTTYRGLIVSFPTDKIFFPLIPTSVYDSKVIPATIKIVGFASPETFKNIAQYTEVDYFKGVGINNLPEGFSQQVNNKSSNFNYTVVKIEAPSKLLTQDLYFNNFVPINVLLGRVIIEIPVVLAILAFIWNSIAASVISALICFKEARSKKILKYVFLGLSNIFSFFGFMFFTFIAKTKEITGEDAVMFETLKTRGYNLGLIKRLDSRKIPFVIIFILVYLAFSIGGAELVKWILTF